MGQRVEEVEGASHVHLFAGRHVKERQVHGAAAAVARLFGDVPLLEQDLFLEVRVEERLHAKVEVLDAPEHEVPDRAGRAVGVEHLEPVAHDIGLVGNVLQSPGRLPCQERDRLFVAVDAVPYEVVGREVADLLHDARHIVGQEDEVRGVHDDLFLVIHNSSSLLQHIAGVFETRERVEVIGRQITQ